MTTTTTTTTTSRKIWKRIRFNIPEISSRIAMVIVTMIPLSFRILTNMVQHNNNIVKAIHCYFIQKKEKKKSLVETYNFFMFGYFEELNYINKFTTVNVFCLEQSVKV